MGIKAFVNIQLPYAIRLDEAKDYSFDFEIGNFSKFQIDFLHNSEDDQDMYNGYFEYDYCLNLRIVAIYDTLDYNDYPHERMPYLLNNQPAEEVLVDLPQNKTNLIFAEISNALDKILSHFRKTTKMFWVENLPVTPVNFLFNCRISYYFYSPDTVSYHNLREYNSCYMETESVNKLNESTFSSFHESWENISQYERYLDKAKICLYESLYDDFIINLSISVEAYIRNYVATIQPENDIILKRLKTKDFKYLDLYYNVILKYLKKKSLIEIEESSFTLLNRLYILRNALMHRGIIDEKALKDAGISKVGFIECEVILKAFQNAINAINEL